MMMSNGKFWYGLALGLLGTLASIASADDAVPGRATLDAMGLGGLQIMSDDAGLAVRGQGFAVAWGQSWASVGKAGSTNGYLAAGPHYASGENYSEAGIRITTSGGGHDGDHHGDGNHGGKKDGGKKDGGWGGGGGHDWKDKGNHGHKNGGKHGRKGGGKHGGHKGDHGGGGYGGHHGGGGKPQTKSIRVYAGGYSSARAG